MTGLHPAIDVVWWIIGGLMAAAALFALWRMIIGPTIVDRMVASDTILTIVICVLGAEMVLNRHTANLPLMLVLALTAFIASVAVARYVSRQERRAKAQQDAGHSLPTPGDAAAGGPDVDETRNVPAATVSEPRSEVQRDASGPEPRRSDVEHPAPGEDRR